MKQSCVKRRWRICGDEARLFNLWHGSMTNADASRWPITGSRACSKYWTYNLNVLQRSHSLIRTTTCRIVRPWMFMVAWWSAVPARLQDLDLLLHPCQNSRAQPFLVHSPLPYKNRQHKLVYALFNLRRRWHKCLEIPETPHLSIRPLTIRSESERSSAIMLFITRHYLRVRVSQHSVMVRRLFTKPLTSSVPWLGWVTLVTDVLTLTGNSRCSMPSSHFASSRHDTSTHNQSNVVNTTLGSFRFEASSSKNVAGFLETFAVQ